MDEFEIMARVKLRRVSGTQEVEPDEVGRLFAEQVGRQRPQVWVDLDDDSSDYQVVSIAYEGVVSRTSDAYEGSGDPRTEALDYQGDNG